MPEGRIDNLVSVVSDMADGALKAADDQGIARTEIEEEIGNIYEPIIHAILHREGGRSN